MFSEVLGAIEPHRTYVVKVTPKFADAALFISTYDDRDPKSPAVNNHGYQRPPTHARFAEISTYYRERDNRFRIPPLLVSVRLSESRKINTLLKLIAAGNVKAIHKKFGRDVLSVIDGQHRLKGLVKAAADDSEFIPWIPVVLYCGLDFAVEADLFNTINATQRKLPKALIETNRGDITEAHKLTYEQQIRRIAFSLCRDRDSVWGPVDGKEQINMTGIRDPEKTVTYEGLRRSTANMFPTTLLERIKRIDIDLPVKLGKRYWKRVSEACAGAWNSDPGEREMLDDASGELVVTEIEYRIKDLVGVAALARLGQDIIRTHLDSGAKDTLERLIQKLAEVDWEKAPHNPWMRSQAGFAGQKELYEILYAWVYSDTAPEGA